MFKGSKRRLALTASLILGASLVLSGCGGDGVEETVVIKDNTETSAAASEAVGTDSADSTGGAADTSGSGREASALPGTNYDAIKAEAAGKASKVVNADSMTLMVYICGSNLESDNGCATGDINEILYGMPGHKLNVVLETGGCKEWQNSVISADTVQRYYIDDNGLELIEDIGKKQITSKETLSDFIKFAKDKYPADRYGIIFWDHGGGTLGGFGGDELYDDQAMDIIDLSAGLKDGGCHFDFVGFDCCLMATAENGVAIAPYADYMIASEETEPGTGWYYTNFISQLDKDPGTSIKDMAKTIINDYLDEENTYLGSGVTLSLIDLSRMSDVSKALNDYMDASEAFLVGGGFETLSNARYNARSYGDDEFEQIDIIDYVEKAAVSGSEAMRAAVESAVILNGTNMSGSNGLAVYYPYYYPEYFSTMDYITSTIGLDYSGYTTFFTDFVSVKEGGQSAGGGNSNPYANVQAGQDETFVTEDTDWYNSELVSQYADSYSYVDSSELTIDEKGDGYVLKLSDDEWSLITKVELQVYADLGDGYLFLGSDDSYHFDGDGDLAIEYDYSWIALNDLLVPFYADERGEYIDGRTYSIGYVPAYLNDSKDVNIWLIWESDAQGPKVLGYTTVTNNHVSNKGYSQFKNGDIIDFYFDFYDYDGYFEDQYKLNDSSIKYDESKGLTAEYELIGDIDTEICYYLQDIYGNEYWTETVRYSG
ncbi:MAG: clostripain-related cysteine peptidase [Eubacteriales bacterium]|nr:clostripain-related cysteine peptidase [Eubacteriales bacterium]